MALQTLVRRQKIVDRLRTEGFCSVTSLAEQLGVSEVTIRNDLSALESEGHVTRIHGGAMLVGTHAQTRSFQERIQVNQDQKRWIARFAADLVEDYDSIILDASTTAYAIAEFLGERHGLTVVTNGIEVALRLANDPTNKVILTGGLLRRESSSLGAQFGTRLLQDLHLSKAFLSCTGWSPGLDAMDDDLFEAEIKSAMSKAAHQVIIVADSTKFARHGLTSFASVSHIDRLITDDAIPEPFLSRFRDAGVHLTLCGQHATRLLEPGVARRRFRIGFANQDDSAPFSTLVRQGLVQSAEQHDIELLLTDNREDCARALANADYFLQEGVDLIVEFNTDVRCNNIIMERMRAAGIPVIAIDIPMPGATFIGVDNYRAGLMAGRLLGHYIVQQWGGEVDRVLSLELPISGPIPAARMQGQLDGLRELVHVPDTAIVPLDSKNTYSDAYHAVSVAVPAMKGAGQMAVLGINDETVLGALAAFAEAGILDRVVTVGFGADQEAIRELLSPGTRMIGAVTSFPERYGDLIIRTALHMLQGQPVSPAIFTNHIYVLADAMTRVLDLTMLKEEMISARDYGEMHIPRPWASASRPPEGSPVELQPRVDKRRGAPAVAIPERVRDSEKHDIRRVKAKLNKQRF